MIRWRLDFLADRSDEAILAEIRRVAAECGGKLTRHEFERRSGKVSLDTIRRRLGNWGAALQRAGCADAFAGLTPQAAARVAAARRMTDAEMLDELRRVYAIVGGRWMSIAAFERHAVFAGHAVKKRFGSWRRAVTLAGLPPPIGSNRYTSEQLLANLRTVWDHLERRPSQSDMGRPPSKIGRMAYIARWGTWLKAVAAFGVWIETGVAPPSSPRRQPSRRGGGAEQNPLGAAPADNERPVSSGNLQSTIRNPKFRAPARSIGPRLRFDVFERDGRRCAICGRGPADGEGVKLQIDHITPVAAGGATTLDNLQTLCRECNLGKSDRRAEPQRRRRAPLAPDSPMSRHWLRQNLLRVAVGLAIAKIQEAARNIPK